MVTNAVFITAVISIAVMSVSSMAVVAKVLSDRITDLGNTLGGRIGGVDGRLGSIDSRMNSLEGAVRDVGERLTALEGDLGKR
jgi:hypothetical protein